MAMIGKVFLMVFEKSRTITFKLIASRGTLFDEL